jgi:hypothetical protein
MLKPTRPSSVPGVARVRRASTGGWLLLGLVGLFALLALLRSMG